MTPEELRALEASLAPRPSVDYGGLEGIPNDAYRSTPFGSTEMVPYEPIRPEQGYRSQLDPMLDQRPDLSGWADDPSQGGLGLATRPQPTQGELPYYRGPFGGVLERLGLTTAVSPLDRYAAQQEFPGINLTPQQARTLGNQYLDLQLAGNRQSQALKLQQLEETKRQNQWEDLFKVLGNDKLSPPQQTEMLKGMAKQNPFAAQAAQSINDKMIGDFKTWQSYLPRTPEAYQEGLQKGEITWPQVAAEIDAAKAQGMEETKALAKETATQRKMQGLLTKFKQDPNAMTDTELDLVDQHFKQQQERALKIQQLQVGIQGSRADLTKKQNAPTEVYSGTQGPQGESVTGIYDPKTGTTRELRGTPIQRVQTDEPKFTPEQAARVSAMNQTLNNLMDLRGALIPDGKKVDRGVLFTSMFGGLPFTGGRDIERYVEDAIETKLRLQTGAAANRDEVLKEAKKFKPSQLDTDETIIGKFDKLERYMQDTFNVLDPSGVVRARLGSAGSNIGSPPIPFDQAYEGLKKTHPTWTNQEIFRELQRRGVQP